MDYLLERNERNAQLALFEVELVSVYKRCMVLIHLINAHVAYCYVLDLWQTRLLLCQCQVLSPFVFEPDH